MGNWNYLIILIATVFINTASAQNLTKENSWPLSMNKKNLYFDKGVFHYGLPAKNQVITQKVTGIRSFYNKATKIERIVLDIDGPALAGLYGYISKEKNKLYLDLYQTEKSETFAPKVNAHFLKTVDVYIIEPKLLSLELSFNTTLTYEVFYLLNPTRIVIDVKS